MFIRYRHIIIIAILLLSTLRAEAQMAMPDYVCVGATKHYNVDPNPVPGSTYTWIVDGVTQTNTTNAIDFKWDKPPGKYPLTVQETSAAGCTGPLKEGEVTVKQWDFSVPPALSECVENLNSVSYSGATNDINTDQPDYYTFNTGNKTLDLDISKFVDYCASTCSYAIRWQIDFLPTPDHLPPHNPVIQAPITGSGQPSEIIGKILFPGDGVTFNEVVHTITYWIKDCAGNESLPHTQTITIKPRPKFE